ncbi:MAG: OmpA family protein, partial [Chitinispirillaceae bacterium]|nr:OmpA family protein [Chitinispirillaceae bacterium]
TSEKGSNISYDAASNSLSLNGNFEVQTAGLGLHGPWQFDGPFKSGLPVNGHGLGVDVGGILYDDNGAMSINVQNLGVLLWTGNVRTVTYDLKTSGLDLYNIVRGIENYDDKDSQMVAIFGARAPNSGDTLDNAPSTIMTFLPLALNIGYSRTYDFAKFSDKRWKKIADNAVVAANYEQQLAPGPGRSFIPRLTIGSELATLHNFVPLRMGFIMGGPEHWGSALGMGFNFRYFSINGAYKSIGNWWFAPARGFELAAGLNVNWGFETDFDKDGIPDIRDKCPKEPEDIDGFEDQDGCPDFDNDKDSILDLNDKCPDKAEDKDGFKDDDGCPDLDNDEDGMADLVDRCPNAPEDMDGFKDEDGCPDMDNDNDRIPDNTDKCMNVAEDVDGFEDENGCPDNDNDQDNVPDTNDKCLNVPGAVSNNGCPVEKKPEPVVQQPTAKEIQILNTKLRGVNFQTGGAELLPVSFAALDYIAGFLRQYPKLKYEIQGHTDNVGEDEYNLLLSAARAGTVRAYLLSKGIPDGNLIAIGYGKTKPIADNKTSKGRALNRRVDLSYIESDQEYETLKVQEAAFRERIRNAKIKGAKY